MNQVALGLAQGDFSQRVTVSSNDEIGALGASLNYLTSELNKNITALSHEKEKVENILKGMSDGVITIDTTGKIILSNPQAQLLLGNQLNPDKINFFTDCKELAQLIARVLDTREYTCGDLAGEKR
jgi:two-component system sensor histidine kinase ResE